MPVYELGEVIAEREFLIRDSKGAETRASARIGRPYPVGEDWQCPYEIAIGEERHTFAIYGVDSLQALVLTLKAVDVELALRSRDASGALIWLGSPHQSVFDPVDRKRDNP
jgi:hypothetical protein